MNYLYYDFIFRIIVTFFSINDNYNKKLTKKKFVFINI